MGRRGSANHLTATRGEFPELVRRVNVTVCWLGSPLCHRRPRTSGRQHPERDRWDAFPAAFDHDQSEASLPWRTLRCMPVRASVITLHTGPPNEPT